MKLAGISIEVRDPSHYVAQVAKALGEYGPSLNVVSREARRLLRCHSEPGGDLWSPAAALSYLHVPNVDALLIREWLSSSQNESRDLWERTQSQGLFSGISSMHVAAAGLCRLVDRLAALRSISRLTCSDLSWPCLYFGRELLHGRSAGLPPVLRRPGKYWSVHAGGKRLLAKPTRRVFESPWCPPGRKVGFAVRNAFDGFRDLREEALCVAYLIDAAGTRDRASSLLYRILLSLPPQRELIFICSLEPSGIRTVDFVLEALELCGFVVRKADLARLPYSHSHDGTGYRTEIWDTLSVRAVKKRAAKANRIVLLGPIGKPTYDARSRRYEFVTNEAKTYGDELTKDVLSLVTGQATLATFAHRMGLDIDDAELDDVLGLLTAHDLVAVGSTSFAQMARPRGIMREA